MANDSGWHANAQDCLNNSSRTRSESSSHRCSTLKTCETILLAQFIPLHSLVHVASAQTGWQISEPEGRKKCHGKADSSVEHYLNSRTSTGSPLMYAWYARTATDFGTVHPDS